MKIQTVIDIKKHLTDFKSMLLNLKLTLSQSKDISDDSSKSIQNIDKCIEELVGKEY